MKKAIAETGGRAYQRDACADGAPWNKALLLVTATAAAGKRLRATCPGCLQHIQLRGRAPCGTDWTKIAAPYWPAWSAAVAKAWTAAIHGHERKHGWQESAPMMITAPSSSAIERLRASGHVPAGGRSNEKAADTMAAGLQPTRKKLPQLIPDGLSPEMHLQADFECRTL